MERNIYEKINNFYVKIKYNDLIKNKDIIIQTFKFLLIITNRINNDNDLNNLYLNHIIIKLIDKKINLNICPNIIYLIEYICSIDNFNKNNYFYINLNKILANIILSVIYKYK